MNSNTHTRKLGEDVINKIKNFKPIYGYMFTEKQKSLIDKLIPNERTI